MEGPTDSSRSLTVVRAPGPPAATASFLERKATREIEDQLQQLKSECEAKDREIERLQEISSHGKLQKGLYKALQENRDLKTELESLFQEQIYSKDISAQLEAQEALTQSVRDEFAEFRREAKLGIDRMKKDREEVENKVITYEQKTVSVQQLEKDTVSLNNELEAKVKEYEAQLRTESALVAKLKDGTRLEELNAAVSSLSESLGQKEWERQIFERDLMFLRNENVEVVQRAEDFEQEVQTTLTNTISFVNDELQKQKDLAAAREIELNEQRQRYSLLEQSILRSDQQMLEMTERIHLYETGYCIDDAMKEQRRLKTELQHRGEDIVKLSEQLNLRETHLEQLAEENRVLRMKAGVNIDWGISISEMQLEHSVRIEKLSALADHYQARVEKLEAERLELLDELRKKAVQSGESGVIYFGLSVDKLHLVEQYIERLREGDETLPVSDSTAVLKEEVEKAYSKIDDLQQKYNNAISDRNEPQENILASKQAVRDKKMDEIMETISRVLLTPAKVDPLLTSDPMTRGSSGEASAIGDDPASHSALLESIECSNLDQLASWLLTCLGELAATEKLLSDSTSTIARYEASISRLSDHVNALFILQSETTRNHALENEQYELTIKNLREHIVNLGSDGLDTTSDHGKSELSDQEHHRKVAILQSNEILLTRKLNALEGALVSLESRDTRSRDDRINSERVLRAHIVQLESSCAEARSQVQLLEAQLRTCVPGKFYERLQQEHGMSHAKLAESLVEQADLQQKIETLHELRQTVDESAARAALADEKAKNSQAEVKVLQEKLDEIASAGDTDIRKVHLLAQVAALEIREGNAVRSLDRSQQQILESARRYAKVSADLVALEEKHHALLVLYHAERSASETLRNNITSQSAEHDVVTSDLKAQTHTLRNEGRRFRKLFQIAKKQAVQLSDHRHEMELQVAGLRKAIIQLQANSDDHVMIGQLHHELIGARLEIRNLQTLADERSERIQSLEADVLRQSKDQDDTVATSFQENSSLRTRIGFMHQCLADMAAINSGGLTAEQAAALHETNKFLLHRLQNARTEIASAHDRRRQAEEALEETRIDIEQISETRSCLDTLSADHVDEQFQTQILEWTKSLRALKISKMHLEHQVSSLQAKNIFVEKSLSENEAELHRLQSMVSEKDTLLVSQKLQFKQQTSTILELSKVSHHKGGESPLEPKVCNLELQAHYESEISRLQASIQHLESFISSKDEVIDVLRQQISRFEAKSTADALASPEENKSDTSSGLCSNKILKAAETTIQGLRDLLSQKNEALVKYRDILDRTLAKYHAEKEVDMLELERLHQQFAEDKLEQTSSLQDALFRIENLQQIPSTLVSAQYLEQQLNEKQSSIQTLSVELETVHNLLKKATAEIASLESDKDQLRDQLTTCKARLAPNQETERLIQELRQQLLEKTRKQTHLEEVILQLKDDMVRFREDMTQSQSPPKANTNHSDCTKKISHLQTIVKRLENQKTEAKQAYRLLEEKLKSTLNDLENSRISSEKANNEASVTHTNAIALKQKLKCSREKNVSLNKKLQEVCSDLEALKHRSSRDLAELKNTLAEKDSRIANLDNKIQEQEVQCPSAKAIGTISQSCSPMKSTDLAQGSAPNKSAARYESAEAVESKVFPFEQWEMKKKLEKRIDVLKTKLKERNEHIYTLEKDAADLLAQVAKLEHNNCKLVDTLRSMDLPSKQPPKKRMDVRIEENLEELHSKLFSAQEENYTLKKRLEVESAVQISQLEFELSSLKNQLKEKPRSAPEKSKLKQELDELSQKHLNSCCENLELRFDKEHASIISQRLKKRVVQLEQLLANQGKIFKPHKQAAGQSIEELTSTINSMAAIIDSLKQDNETLKLNSHSHLKYSEAVRALKKAKKDWSAEVEALTKQLHAKGDEALALTRADAASKLAAKTLRRDLTKIKKDLAAKESEVDLLAQSIVTLEKQVDLLQQTVKDQETMEKKQDDAVPVRLEPAPTAPLLVSSINNSQQVTELNKHLADLIAENEALKTELGAFDMSFFDEIEDLKFQYAEASKSLSRYRAEYGDLHPS